MTEENFQAQEEVPASPFLVAAGIPAGLLLALGSHWVYIHVATSEEARQQAGSFVLILQILQGLGALAVLASLGWLLKIRSSGR